MVLSISDACAWRLRSDDQYRRSAGRNLQSPSDVAMSEDVLLRKFDAVLVTILLLTLSGPTSAQGVPAAAQIKPITGHFLSEGHSVDEFHCEPTAPGKHPVVFLIHGCAPKGFGDDEFKQMCVSLAEDGYYAMFIEYYSRT